MYNKSIKNDGRQRQTVLARKMCHSITVSQNKYLKKKERMESLLFLTASHTIDIEKYK